MSKCLWCKGTIEYSMSFSLLFYEQPTESRLCNGCRDSLSFVADEMYKCSSCCKLSDKDQCQDCLNWKQHYPNYPFKNESLFYYNTFAKEYMERYKILGDCELSLLFSCELRRYFKPKLKDSVIVPIPISYSSKVVRGFNQVELLLESAEIPYITMLKNVGKGEKQAKKKRSERMNMNQPFILDKDLISHIDGRSIIIVDDLYTTGRTLFHAADALKSCYSGNIQTFSLFR